MQWLMVDLWRLLAYMVQEAAPPGRPNFPLLRRSKLKTSYESNLVIVGKLKELQQNMRIDWNLAKEK